MVAEAMPVQGTSLGEVPPVWPVLRRCRKVDKSLGPDLGPLGVSALGGCFPPTAAETPHKRVEEEAL